MMRVPLIIKTPDATMPARDARDIDFLCVNVDLPVTLADFASADMPACDGVSLKPLLTGEKDLPQRDAVIGQYYSKQQWVNPIRMIRTRDAKYVRYRVHGEELYDLKQDPSEIHNRADDPSYAETKARLASALERWIKRNDDPFHSLNPTDRSGEPIATGGRA